MVSTLHTKPETLDIMIWNLVIKLEFVDGSFCKWKKGKLGKSSQFEGPYLGTGEEDEGLRRDNMWTASWKKSMVADIRGYKTHKYLWKSNCPLQQYHY